MRSGLRIATRGSPLALWQASYVAERLVSQLRSAQVELVVVETAGDRRSELPVWEMGGQGVFVKEVQSAVLDGRADLAVHSAKDLPSDTPPGLILAAVPVRADPRDVLVGSTLAGLPPGGLVATGSVRRRAQLSWWRPDLTFTSLRGSIATRLDKVPPGGAIVMAKAALDRLGLSAQATETLPVSVMLPQVAQGAIGVECRSDDPSTLAAVEAIDDPDAHLCVIAERSFLSRLGGGCDLPVGAYARVVAPGQVIIDGMLAAADGRMLMRLSATGSPDAGAEVAAQLLAAGGDELLRR